MPVINQGASRQLSYAWHNACVEKIPSIGTQLADRLDQELGKLDTIYQGDDEELLVAIQRICEEYTLRPSQQRSLMRSLKADFYRITGEAEGSLVIPDRRPRKEGALQKVDSSKLYFKISFPQCKLFLVFLFIRAPKPLILTSPTFRPAIHERN